jgi:hypothetical protein
VITTSEAQAMTIEPDAEITNFRLPDQANIWFMPRRGRDFMYEDNYLPGKIDETEDGIRPSLPMLYETNGRYGLIMEADRHGTYTGSLLRLENGRFLSRQILRDKESCVWAAVDPKSGERYVALFNFREAPQTIRISAAQCAAAFGEGWFSPEEGTWEEIWSGNQSRSIGGEVASHGALLFHRT